MGATLERLRAEIAGINADRRMDDEERQRSLDFSLGRLAMNLDLLTAAIHEIAEVER